MKLYTFLSGKCCSKTKNINFQNQLNNTVLVLSPTGGNKPIHAPKFPKRGEKKDADQGQISRNEDLCVNCPRRQG